MRFRYSEYVSVVTVYSSSHSRNLCGNSTPHAPPAAPDHPRHHQRQCKRRCHHHDHRTHARNRRQVAGRKRPAPFARMPAVRLQIQQIIDDVGRRSAQPEAEKGDHTLRLPSQRSTHAPAAAAQRSAHSSPTGAAARRAASSSAPGRGPQSSPPAPFLRDAVPRVNARCGFAVIGLSQAHSSATSGFALPM